MDAPAAQPTSPPSLLPLVGVSFVALSAGASNVLITRILIETPCPTSCFSTNNNNSSTAVTRPLAAPIYATLLAFIAMSLSLIIFCITQRTTITTKRRRHFASSINEALVAINNEDVESDDEFAIELIASDKNVEDGKQKDHDTNKLSHSMWPLLSRYQVLIAPTLLDVFSTALAAAALLFVSASVGSATRGTLLIFTGIAAAARGTFPSLREWRSIVIAAVGASLVGTAAVLDAGGDGDSGGSTSSMTTVVLGLGLAILGNAAQALQVVVEGALLSAKGPATPNERYSANEVNGVEGVMGALMLFIALFISGSVGGEDVRATGCCLVNEPRAVLLSLTLIAAFAASTAAFMHLGNLAGLHLRAALLVSRSAVVWGAELTLGALGSGDGATWGIHSPLAAVGFAILVVGALDQARAHRGTS